MKGREPVDEFARDILNFVWIADDSCVDQWHLEQATHVLRTDTLQVFNRHLRNPIQHDPEIELLS